MSPVLTWTNEKLTAQVKKLLTLPGSKLLFGGNPVEGTTVPKCYGAFECTAVFIPLKTILSSQENFDLATSEVFAPV